MRNSPSLLMAGFNFGLGEVGELPLVFVRKPGKSLDTLDDDLCEFSAGGRLVDGDDCSNAGDILVPLGEGETEVPMLNLDLLVPADEDCCKAGSDGGVDGGGSAGRDCSVGSFGRDI